MTMETARISETSAVLSISTRCRQLKCMFVCIFKQELCQYIIQFTILSPFKAKLRHRKWRRDELLNIRNSPLLHGVVTLSRSVICLFNQALRLCIINCTIWSSLVPSAVFEQPPENVATLKLSSTLTNIYGIRC
jgi:hypothetical protein